MADTPNKPHEILWARSEMLCFKGKAEQWQEFADKFNEDPKLGYAFLVKTGLVEGEEVSQMDKAIIFHECNELNLSSIGNEIARDKELLDAFSSYLNFAGMGFLDSLREYLSTFVLPGESSLIDRVFVSFAKHYNAANPGCFTATDKSIEDMIYILTYAVIMLNTDLTCHQIKKKMKMKKSEFISANKNVQGEGDPSEEFLGQLYDDVRDNPLVKSAGKSGGKYTKSANMNSPPKKNSSWKNSFGF